MPMVRVSNGGTGVVTGMMTATTMNLGFKPRVLVLRGTESAYNYNIDLSYCEDINPTQYRISYCLGASSSSAVMSAAIIGQTYSNWWNQKLDINSDGFSFSSSLIGYAKMQYIVVK